MIFEYLFFISLLVFAIFCFITFFLYRFSKHEFKNKTNIIFLLIFSIFILIIIINYCLYMYSSDKKDYNAICTIKADCEAYIEKNGLDVKDQDILKEIVATNEMINRSEEHTSELQSPDHLVCRLLLEK